MKIFDETEMPNVMKPVLQVSLCAIIFVLSYFRSDKAGKLLAEALRKGLQGNRYNYWINSIIYLYDRKLCN
jgi:hypothetical protein